MESKDLSGKKFGRWLVLSEVDSQNYLCKCTCDLGTVKKVNRYSLINGKSKSCGCLQRELASKSRKPLPNGSRYGKLTVIGIDEEQTKKHSCIRHLCRCNCGKITTVGKHQLLNGHTRSCGCLIRESKISLRQPLPNGSRYGKLTVIGIDEEKYRTKHETWHVCKCECGNTFSVSRANLLRGHTRSCGCGKLHSSMWELNICRKIEERLKDRAICVYQKINTKQKKLKNSAGEYFFYDLLIEPFDSNRKVFIECNGIAFHPKSPEYRNKDGSEWKSALSKESADEKYKRDMKKKELAEQNGYEVYYIWDDAPDDYNINYILSLL